MCAVVALAALAAIWSAASSAHDPNGASTVAPRPHAVVPAGGQRLPYGTAVRGSCLTVDHAVSNEVRGWGVYTFDPGRVSVIGSAGRELLPPSFVGSSTPPGLDAFASASTRPADRSVWQVAGSGRQMPASPEGSCRSSIEVAAPDASASGGSIVLRRPGPYVYWTFDHTVHWVKVSDTAADPAALPCAQDPNQAARSPAPAGSPPSRRGHGWHWAIDSFCTTVKWRSFDVLGSPGRCGLTTDASLWPGVGYINQYSAGIRLGLPSARGSAGGNACGPSSLLMAMLQSVQRNASDGHVARARKAALLPLQNVFDQTMEHRRGQMPSSPNEFVGSKASVFLRRHGWNEVTLERLGTDADSIENETTSPELDRSNEAVIDRALNEGPVVIATDLGTGPWGTTGDGHMIVVTGRDRTNPGEYVVYDPAGNYFADPTGHYGAESCGNGVLYPASWLLAYTTGGWYLQLGRPD